VATASDALAAAFRAERIREAEDVATRVEVALRLAESSTRGGSELDERFLSLAGRQLVASAGRQAQTAKIAYLAMRRAEGVEVPVSIPDPPAADVDGARSSLYVAARKLLLEPGESVPDEGLLTPERVNVVKQVAKRHSIDGARRLISAAARSDRDVLLMYRETDEDPCYFCALLASRGPDYLDDAFDKTDARYEGPGDVKVHDGCACVKRTVWKSQKSKFELPEMNRLAEDIWKMDEVSKAGDNRAQINAFRRLWEGRARTAGARRAG